MLVVVAAAALRFSRAVPHSVLPPEHFEVDAPEFAPLQSAKLSELSSLVFEEVLLSCVIVGKGEKVRLRCHPESESPPFLTRAAEVCDGQSWVRMHKEEICNIGRRGLFRKWKLPNFNFPTVHYA